MAVLASSSQLYTENWVGEAQGTTDLSWHFHVVHTAPLYSFEHMPSQTIYVIRLLDCLDQSTCGLVLIGRSLGLSTSDK